MTRIYLFFLLMGGVQWGFGQSNPPLDNIVPNPSFESYSATPIGWYYRGTHFTNVMRYWSAATGASPDAFGPKVRVPAHWIDKGFGDQYARTGKSMAGVTVYGCDEGKPHCREYIQVQLLESLVPFQDYYIEFSVVHLPRSLQTNNLGAYFSKEKVEEKIDKQLEFAPHFNVEEIIETENHEWKTVSGRFYVKESADYIILGNFFPDNMTLSNKANKHNLQFAYYYIDDVIVKKVPPILDVPIPPDDLSLIEIEAGRMFELRNIFFEWDKAELLPRSFTELNKLLHILQEHSDMSIEVRGHTDSTGSSQYNLYLSRKRAKAVVLFLIENGIAAHRLHYLGRGSKQPIATNKNEDGRRRNRRVEVLVLGK